MAPGPKLALLPGDGIGPEIMGAARQVLDRLGGFEYDERLAASECPRVGRLVRACGAELTT